MSMTTLIHNIYQNDYLFKKSNILVKTDIYSSFHTELIGSAVVEYFTRDRAAAGLSLTGVTVLCP